jgi:hypothetical protein
MLIIRASLTITLFLVVLGVLPPIMYLHL